MELIQKKIHTDGANAHLLSQIVLEEDVNISDVKPDVGEVLSEHGRVILEEIRTLEHQVMVRGRLAYEVLYVTDSMQPEPACMKGELPFQEKISVEQVNQGDSIQIHGRVEDLNVSIVNSRKLSLKVIIDLEIMPEESKEQTVGTGLSGAEHAEYRQCHYDITELVQQKKDIFRIRETMKLPEAKSDIGEIIWTDVRFQSMAFRPMDDKIMITGEMKLFCLYQTDMGDVEWYEYTEPINSPFACDGCSDAMFVKVLYEPGAMQIESAADGNGDKRLLQLDGVLDLTICLFTNEKIPLLADVYDVEKEIDTTTEWLQCRKLCQEFTVHHKLQAELIAEQEKNIGTVLRVCADPKVQQSYMTEQELLIKGYVTYCVLYQNLNENTLCTLKKQLPFEFRLRPQCNSRELFADVILEVEACDYLVSGENKIEITLGVESITALWEEQKIPAITGIQVSDMDIQKQNELPVFSIWVAEEQDSLWKIGKQFYVPVDRIKSVNNLTGDEIEAGQKLLIVR